MKKIFVAYFFLASVSIAFCQDNLLWQGYFSYNQVNEISESPTQIFAASQNAIFSKNITTNDEKTTTTVNGLSGETISAMYHSTAFNKTLVGYENGLVIVINDADGSMFSAVGIVQKQIPSGIKKINHFMEHNGVVYVSCDFGVVQFFLNNSEFGDTYFFDPSISNYQAAIQTTILNNDIYVLTRSNGIKKAALSNPNLNDFSQWQIFNAGYWSGLVTVNNQLVGANSDNNLYKFTGTVPTAFYFLPNVVDFRVYENKLIATNPSKVVVFNNLLSPTHQVNNTAILPINPTFTTATIINGKVNIGTTENGVYTTNDGVLFNNITPNCPIRNVIYNVNASSGNLWAVYGGYSGDYNPYTYNNFGTVNQYGISKFDGNNWKNIPYSQVLGAKALTRIAVNPKNGNQVFISSMQSGLLKVENDVPTLLMTSANSGLETLEATPSLNNIRINASAFDKSGNLYLTNARINNGLKKFKTDGTWQSIPMAPIASATINIEGYLQCDYGAMAIDKNGTKWLATSKNGVVGYNENGNVYKRMISTVYGSGNLPTFDARVLAVDNKNQLWIGTTNGLRVLSSVDSFNGNSTLTANSIIILDNGQAQELMYEQWITDIVVDGSNRKWIATNNSGVFLLSNNGQKTIYHFTTANSPLPSDSILDVDINPITGEVFFATIKGMVSFKGVATKARENLENVYIYPNPVRPDFNGTVKVSGLIDKANVKITDIEGNLVYETTSSGGTIEWDTTAFGTYKVASGVYMVFVSAADGAETTIKKVMIVR